LYVDEFGSEFLREVGIHNPACSIGRAPSNTPLRERLLDVSTGGFIPPASTVAVATWMVLSLVVLQISKCCGRKNITTQATLERSRGFSSHFCGAGISPMGI
jgi:hypothetical protein